MARRKGAAGSRTFGFDQARTRDIEGKVGDNKALSTVRAQAGKRGDTGRPDIVTAYRPRRVRNGRLGAM